VITSGRLALIIVGNSDDESPHLMFTKGSRELISERCDRIQNGEHLNPITPEQRQKILTDKLIVF